MAAAPALSSGLEDRRRREGRGPAGDPEDSLSPPVPPTVGTPIPVPRSPQPDRAQADALPALSVEQLRWLFAERKARHGVPAHGHLVLT